MNKIINILGTFGLTLLVLLAMNVGQASAINYTGPDENDFTPASPSDMMFEVARYCIGCGGALEAVDSTVVVYLRTSSGVVNIINGSQNCAGDNYNAPTTFYFYRGDNPIGAYAHTPISDSAMNCTTYPVTVTGLPVVVIGSETFYTVTVRAVHTGTQGINAFEINAPSNGIVSYYSGSGEYFTIQDRNSASTGNSTFNLKFGSDCSVTANTSAILRWADDDHISGGGNWNQTSADGYYWEVYESRKDGTGRARIAYLNFDGSTNVATSGWKGDDQPPFGDENGWATIPIKPNYRYEWIWHGVRKTNGVNFQVPYNSIFYLYECGSYDYQASINLNRTTARPGDTIVATHTNTNTGTAVGPAWLRAIHVSTGDSITTRVTSWGDDTGNVARQYGVAGIGPPASRSANYTVNSNAPDGSQICFYARVAGTGFTDSSAPKCVTIQNPGWNYTINASGSPPPSANFPKPGNNITINSTVTNNDAGLGASYEQRFRVTQGAGNLVSSADVRFTGQAGLAGGASRPHSAVFQVTSTPADGSQICFVAEVSPYSGQTYPLPPSASSSGWLASEEICYTIFNERFDLSLTVALPAIGFPGQSININYTVCNDTDDELNAILPAPGSSNRGDSSPANFTTSGALNPGLTSNTNQVVMAGGCWLSGNRSVVIPTTAVVGDRLCATLNSSRNYGYSDGTSLGGTPLSETVCLTIANGPYVQVLGHDTWAGGGFAVGSSCSPTNGSILTLAQNRLNSSGTPQPPPGVGAMDQYAAFASGSITNFGTAGDPLSSTLTFANNPSLGNFGAGRCLANLFDGGGAGGNIDDALWNNASGLGNDFNGFTQGNTAQHRISGAATHNNSGNPLNGFTGSATVLINGDFHISKNIILSSNLSLGNVPFLVFIVTGDIRIDHSVTRIDGMYISAGRIDTCNDGSPGSLSPVTSLTSGNPCNEHLEVNGSLIAKEIAFRRTHGGTNEAATGSGVGARCLSASAVYTNNNLRCSAETIIFHPWFYLATPPFNRGGGPEANKYPIQQLRDLPPIF